jgi:hypothetical protein
MIVYLVKRALSTRSYCSEIYKDPVCNLLTGHTCTDREDEISVVIRGQMVQDQEGRFNHKLIGPGVPY